MEYYLDLFSKRLTEARIHAGLKQRELAELAGITPALISRYESGKASPRAETRERLAKILNVNLRYFLEDASYNQDEVLVSFISPIDGSIKNELYSIRSEILTRTQSKPSDLICFRIMGNQMSPVINSDDVVLVNKKHKTLDDGKIFLIQISSSIVVKRLYKTIDNGVRVVSDNKLEYPELIIKPEDLKNYEFKIMGKVIWRSGLV
ncbi:helix-turn-helix domain-containing protein [Acinetobacter soli]|uniref:XRE family transcriptional regulator n=1 Tax=Acinetobacter soli TaxID=487316 RepID=UPI001C4812C7|nr:XRE family transcriptional regulator [Acinetobacter soli]MBV6549947.1 helix-turn-helix domain-containing protein [Acinetobacter soli]